MKRLCLALFLVAAGAKAQYTDFAHHGTASAGHANGLPAGAFPTLCSGISPATGNFLYFSASACWTALATPADGTYSITFTGGIPSYTAAGGSAAFSAITSGTNTTAAMVVGTGASLAVSGSGTIAATSLGALTGLPSQSANTVVANVTAGSASPTAASLPSCVDTAGNHLNYTNGTGFSCGSSTGTTLSRTTSFGLFDDFTGTHANATSPQADLAGWQVVNGAGAGTGTTATAPVANHPGIVVFNTGTTGTTASTALNRENASKTFILNGSEQFDWLVLTDPNLSTGTNTYNIEIGWNSGGVNQTAEATNGLYFSYTDGTNSGKWLFHACKATVCGTLDTTVTVVASTWYHLRVVANSSSSYEVFVNATDVGAFTTAANIPTAPLVPSLRIWCTANAAASTKTVSLDYFYMLQTGITR